MRKYAITDIHGCLLSFYELLNKIALTTADELYLLGDYIDRGPDSQKVLDLIMELREDGYQIHCLTGNHDFAMMDASTDPEFFKQWHDGWGGKQTMESFGIDSLDEVPQKYWKFLNELELVLEVDDYILVHAGLDFQNADPLRPDVNMIYIRHWYDQVKYEWLGERKILHGHTPTSKESIERMVVRLDIDQVLDIDAGCFAEHIPGKGYLCAYELTSRELFFVKNLDDVSSYWGR